MRKIEMIPSKSDAHRAKICAALSEITSERKCRIECGGTSQDIEATEKCLSALKEGRTEMYCGESGSTFAVSASGGARVGKGGIFLYRGKTPEAASVASL